MDDFDSLFNSLQVAISEYAKGFGEIENLEMCEELKKDRIRFCPPQTFYLEYNLVKREITWSHNAHLIGFNDFGHGNVSDFTINHRKYFKQIYAASSEHCKRYAELGLAAYQVASEELVKKNLKINKNCAAVPVPIKDIKDGTILVLEQIGVPFGLDKNKNLVSNLNHYTITSQPFKPSLKIEMRVDRQEWQKLLIDKIAEFDRQVAKKGGLSPRAILLKKYYCDSKKSSASEALKHLTKEHKEHKWSTRIISRLNREILAVVKKEVDYIQTGYTAALYLCEKN